MSPTRNRGPLSRRRSGTGGKNPAPTDGLVFKIYLDLLPSVLHELDPLRPYIPGSPCGGADEINSQTGGDVHWWYQVFMSNDPARKMKPNFLPIRTPQVR